MSDEPKRRSRAWIWWAMLALLVLYPLSIGPAKLIGWRFDGCRRGACTRFVENAYRPITDAGHSTGTNWLVMLYSDLWTSMAPTHFD